MTNLAQKSGISEPLLSLQNRPQFIAWKAVQYAGEPKPRKIPINYQMGAECSAHDAANWTTYENAVAMAPLVGGTGVGFVLTPLDPIACIDLDACLLDDKTWSPFALQILAMFPDAAVELSYSGNGLHLWFQYDPALVPANHKTRSKDVPGLEVYTSKRFIALGSKVFGGSSVTNYTPSLTQLLNYYLPGTASEAAEWSDTPVAKWNGPEDDGELIQKMLASKATAASAFSGKASLADLWNCNEEKLAETYPSRSGDVFDRSAADAALFSHLAFWTGKNGARMDRIFRRSGLVRPKYLDRPDYQRASITQACGWTTNVYGQVAVGDAAMDETEDSWKQEFINTANDKLLFAIEREGRTAIKYDDVNLSDILVHVEEAIFRINRNDLVMAHTQGLVTVCEKRPTTVREIIREKEAGIGEHPMGLLISRYGHYSLGLRLSESCSFLSAKKDRLIKISPPSKLIKTMLETSYRQAPALVGIIEHPAVKADGFIIDSCGFDSNTGFYTHVPKNLVPDLPEIITQYMAIESYRWIVENVLQDFPFASELDCAGAVSLILTVIQRRLMIGSEGAPMFATTAPVQSSGKTSLIRVAAYLVLGIGVPVTSWPDNDEEMGKHLLAILMEGLPVVLFDNLPEGGKIESDELAKASTAEKYRRRILGENREGEAPTNVVWCFTGNNIQPIGDFNTRTVTIYLDPNCESPDRRSFSRGDLEAWCLNHRAEFFLHALIILAGYRRQFISSGARIVCAPTRFKDWDLQVREPLIWAGAPDPALLFDRNKAGDPQKEGRKQLLAAWYGAHGSTPVQLKQILNSAATAPANQELLHAIEDLVPLSRLNTKSLSSVLQKFVNQWFGDYRLQKSEQSIKSNTSAKWFVELKQTPLAE
jgi:hypothetical protein